MPDNTLNIRLKCSLFLVICPNRNNQMRSTDFFKLAFTPKKAEHLLREKEKKKKEKEAQKDSWKQEIFLERT